MEKATYNRFGEPACNRVLRGTRRRRLYFELDNPFSCIFCIFTFPSFTFSHSIQTLLRIPILPIPFFFLYSASVSIETSKPFLRFASVSVEMSKPVPDFTFSRSIQTLPSSPHSHRLGLLLQSHEVGSSSPPYGKSEAFRAGGECRKRVLTMG